MIKLFQNKILFFCLLCSLFLSGCNNSQSNETVPATTEGHDDGSIVKAATPEESSSSVIIQPFSMEEIKALDESVQNYGYGSKNRDNDNRPNDCVDYEEQYSKYDAHFLGENVPTIYLSFDEGYEYGLTDDMLDILKEKQVSAIFFVTKHYVEECPDLIQRMIDEGHIIGNHSAAHPADGLPSLSIEEQIEDTMELHDYLLDNFQYEMTLYRFPAGVFSEQSMAVIQSLNYTTLFWSFAYEDWLTDTQPDPTRALEKMTSQLHNGAIYLLHAVSETNNEILDDFIDQARAAGYEFGIYQ